MEEALQNTREKNERLKIIVRQLEEALEREKEVNIHCQSQVRSLQQEVVAKDCELRNQVEVMRVVVEQLRESQQARGMLEAKLQGVAEQMESQEKRYDKNCQELKNQLRENKRLLDRVTSLEQQLDLERSHRERDRGEFQQQLQLCGEEFQRQLQRDRGEFQQLLQQQSARLQHLEQHLQHVERVAEGRRHARLQQPETRTWIIQRNEVGLSNDVLGEGSWGIVRKGTFRGSPVAVKVLHRVILSSHNRSLFEREMEISSRCRHFNIVQFMGATLDDQNPLLVTELLDCNLTQLLKQRQLNREEIPVVSLAVDVARGLNYMHCNQPPIVHRDVKSDNVLLKRWDNSWIAKVSDLGAANFRRLVMTPSQGTPLYAAPEAGTREYSELVDVYSFGLLVLEMCIRKYPVRGQIADQIKHVPCPRLQGLIGRCVEQDPERRPRMGEVIQVLTQLMR